MDSSEAERLIGPELAQDDRNFHAYSIPRPDVLEVILDSERRLVILNAPKGCGKSGLLLSLERALTRPDAASARVIKIFQGEVEFLDEQRNVNEFERRWRKFLYLQILIRIGCELQDYNDADEATAVLAAVYFRRRASPPGRRSAQDATSADPTPEHGLDQLVARLLKTLGRRTWLLLDEMDEFYSDTPARSGMLAGLLLACKNITQQDISLNVRVTIRPHILTLLRDRFEGLSRVNESEIRVSWSEAQLREMLARRVATFDRQSPAQLDLPLPGHNAGSTDAWEISGGLIGRYFSDFDVSFQPEKKSDYRAIWTLSLWRPRWALELCRLALIQSQTRKAAARDFEVAMLDFGRNRRQFLGSEHRHHLPDLDKAIASLVAIGRREFGNAAELKRSLVAFGVREQESLEVLDVAPITASESEAARRLAESLFIAEVIRAKQISRARGDRHKFFGYADDHDLLSSWRSSKDLQWEVHPTFSIALRLRDLEVYRIAGRATKRGSRRRT